MLVVNGLLARRVESG